MAGARNRQRGASNKYRRWSDELDRPSAADAGPSPLGRAVDALPGLLMLLGGLALVAMAALTPAWLELGRLDAQRELMQQQADALTEQTRRYETFHQAVRADDPVLIERLAYTQLRREPRGRQSVPVHTAGGGGLPPGDIDRWLRVEPASADPDLLERATPSTRLTRLAGGVTRFVLLAAGMFCVVGGLWWGPRRSAA